MPRQSNDAKTDGHRLAFAAKRCLDAFLLLTSTSSEENSSLRALVFHMLEGHAPGFFRRCSLATLLNSAMKGLQPLSIELPENLPADDGMARIDAWYLRRLRGYPHPDPDPACLERYLRSLEARGEPLHGWIIQWMCQDVGVRTANFNREWEHRGGSLIHDLYWVTHLVLLETRYLSRPLKPGTLPRLEEELFRACHYARARRHIDVAAELAICLQVVGRRNHRWHTILIDELLEHQKHDGSVMDNSLEARGLRAHCTGASLVAFAGGAREP